MAYHEFTLETVLETFRLKIERADLFSGATQREFGATTRAYLKSASALASVSRTEKAKSEFIISPFMVEWVNQLPGQISLFSGIEFNVDRSCGLNGNCDYIVGKGDEPVLLNNPVIAVVESKNDNLASGFGQCIAEMVAAQFYNKSRNPLISDIFGVVTTGGEWKFLRLQGKTVSLDDPIYYLNEPDKILGILIHIATHL